MSTNTKPAAINAKAPLWAPTHRYLGSDKLVFYFAPGDELKFLQDWENDEANGIYENAEGETQIVQKSCVEEL